MAWSPEIYLAAWLITMSVVRKTFAFVTPHSVFTRFNAPSASAKVRTSKNEHDKSGGALDAVSFTGDPSTISSNDGLLPGIRAIDQANDELLLKLDALTEKPHFRFYSVDILASCEYMPQEMFECYSETCEIYPVDEEDVPGNIRSADQEEYEFDLDGWARWDMPSEDYYDTLQFPDGYTGYDGSDIWGFIHNRICFEGFDYDDNHWKADFNKAVSGLHSMISLQVVRGIKEKVQSGEQFTDAEVWTDPAAEFNRRLSPVGETPLALENLYFCFMLLLKAASKAKQRLLQDCDTGKIDQDAAPDLKAILSLPLLQDASVDYASQKLHDHAVQNSDSIDALWQARGRCRDLLRIMNCVQCNKCRLHGKISVLGLTTAMQILVGDAGEGSDPKRVHRVELAALIATLDKFSRAVKFAQEMR